MRDEQVRRYSRHILLSDVGGLGQTALLVAVARIDLRDDGLEHQPDAGLIAASYLAAGGVGTVVVQGATSAQLTAVAARGPDSLVVPRPILDADRRDPSTEVVLPPRPYWWPSAEGNSMALAFWRGGTAATRWMAERAKQ